MNNFAPAGDPLYNYADNTKYRGTWEVWLRDTVSAEEQWHRDAVCRSIINFTNGAKCKTCRDHSRLYVRENDPKKHSRTNQELFTYLVTFMNSIQTRKKRKLYNPEILFSVFSDGQKVCTEDCDNKDKPLSVTNNNSTVRPPVTRTTYVSTSRTPVQPATGYFKGMGSKYPSKSHKGRVVIIGGSLG
jgi:hypothetical protein